MKRTGVVTPCQIRAKIDGRLGATPTADAIVPFTSGSQHVHSPFLQQKGEPVVHSGSSPAQLLAELDFLELLLAELLDGSLLEAGAAELPAGALLEAGAAELPAGALLEAGAAELPAGALLEAGAAELLAGAALFWLAAELTPVPPVVPPDIAPPIIPPGPSPCAGIHAFPEHR